MKLSNLKTLLKQHPDKGLQLLLADGNEVPQHFHITEVGQVQKHFIDCGGTEREQRTCLLQAWVASDVDHRINSTKFLKILELASKVVPDDDLEVEIEYEAAVISQYPLVSSDVSDNAILLKLGLKHTDCLAKEVCGVPDDPNLQKQKAALLNIGGGGCCGGITCC